MKKLLYVGMLLFIIAACIKEIPEQEAGNIPGMGNAGGELQAVEYEFHEDLIFSDINGVSPGQNTILKSASLDDDLQVTGYAHGSGDQVVVALTITNNSDEVRSAFFRAGTIFEVDLPGYQHGILLAPVIICLDPGETVTFELYLYCVNQGFANSDETANYKIIGVTSSKALLDFIALLDYKMVNYEHYVAYGIYEDYLEVKEKLQEIIWIITNGDGNYSDYDEFIDGLTELPDGVYPDGIYELDAKLPVSWCSGWGQETAWGGNTGYNVGSPSAWWYSFGVESEPRTQNIYAGQYTVIGEVTYNPLTGTLEIDLDESIAKLQFPNMEPVKVAGYDVLPDSRPSAGNYEKTGGITLEKGSNLLIENVGSYNYYLIHLDAVVLK